MAYQFEHKSAPKNLRKISVDILKSPPVNVRCPSYRRDNLKCGIVHLSVGAFHRSHQALYIEELLENHAVTDWAICGVGIMPHDQTLNQALVEQDFLYTLVERTGRSDSARIIGSLKNHLLGFQNPEVVFAVLADPQTRIVSMTATEGGYCFNQGTGKFDFENPGVVNDLKNPLQPKTIYGYLTEGLRRRFKAGIAPFTVMSCDNMQGNGHIAQEMLLSFCERQDSALADWISKNVSFPSCMVDRITPVTTEAERELVRREFGLDDACPVVAEDFKQWVIEDKFCNGRPPLELVGAQFVSDVAPFEKMKLRLLNATHSAMGYLGYLLGYRYIHEIAVADEYLPYLQGMMDLEVTPTVGQVPGIDLSWYKKTVLSRFANEAIRDQALRICMDGSAKIPKFVLPIIADQLIKGGPISRLTLCVASWLRFLNAQDEQGAEIPINDPMADRLRKVGKLGKQGLPEFLAMEDIFGELATSPVFVAELTKQFNSLYDLGARATLQACIV